MRMKTKMINKAAPHFGNPSFFTLFRSYAALGLRNATHLEKLIQTRCKSGTLKLDEALGFFHSLIHTRPMPSVSAFNQLIGALSKLNHYSAVVSMFREMMALDDFHPDVRTMNIVTKCFCRLNKVDLAFSVLAITLKRGLQPDAYIFSVLLHGLCKTHNTLKAMRDTGVKPDIFTYNSLICGLCHSDQRREATWFLDKLKDQGVLPNVVTFSTLVDALSGERRTKEALSLLHLMIQRDVKPDVITYTSLLNALCKLSQWEEATRLLKEMVSRKVFPDTETLNLLLDAFAEKEMTGKAYETFELLIEQLKTLPKT